MKKYCFAFLTFCFTFFTTVNSAYNSTGPTWLPSPYFRAGNNKVIATKTGYGQQTFYTFTFSSALSGIPNLAYGVKNYRGMDTMRTQSFEILRRNLTSSLFTVSIEIFGVTNIFVLTVPYLAIDPVFPHHLNSFDNVPVNHTYGPMTNFSERVDAVTTFTNTLNYTLQSAANKYKTFTDPLSSNKIVLFLTSFEINGTTGIPMDFTVVVSILNSSHYQWTVKIDRSAYVGKVHFSQIVYNQDDVAASKTYAIVYEDWTAYVSGTYAFTPFPAELMDNMITALVDFSATSGSCGIEYNWQFVTNFMGYSNVIYQNRSSTSNSGPYTSMTNCGFDRTRSTVFYIKTWKCGAPFIYYNLTADSCQNGCADYFYANSTTGTCESCYFSCIACTLPNDSTSCSACEPGFNRTLTNGSCVCNSGYFDDWHGLPCRNCSLVDPNCLTCTYAYNSSKTTSDYSTIFALGSWPTTIKPDYKCTFCKSNTFLNSSNLCQPCSLNYCLTCANLTACQTCNSTANATKYTDNLCYLCNVANCLMCNPDNVCVTCATGYFVSSGVCSTLCGDGFKVGSQQCDDGNTRGHDGCSATCTIEPCNLNCSCDGWILPWVNANGSCTTVCGDNLKRGSEQCDDGNAIDHDGCSSTCTIEPCNLNCSCDGWILPWVNTNGFCTAFCGDSLKRGMEECDDGNTNAHDGCSPTCKLEPCNVSCLCDGWVQPWVNGSCSSVCGDNLKRESEQCDDGNAIDHDGCSSSCTIEPCNLNCSQNQAISPKARLITQTQEGFTPSVQKLSVISSNINSFPGSRQIFVYFTPIFAFFDDYWYYIYHQDEYIQLQYMPSFLVLMQIINRQRILPDFLNFGIPLNISTFVHSNYTNYTHEQIYIIQNHQTYFMENIQFMIFQQYIFIFLGVIFVKLLVFLLEICIPKPALPSSDKSNQKHSRNYAKFSHRIKEATHQTKKSYYSKITKDSVLSGLKMRLYKFISLKSILLMLFGSNLIFISFTFSSQIRNMFSFNSLDTGNLTLTIIEGFIVIVFTFFIALYSQLFCKKRRVEAKSNGIWDSENNKKAKTVYLNREKRDELYLTYFTHIKTILYGFIHGFFINYPNLQYVLLVLVKIYLVCILISKRHIIKSFSLSLCIFLYYIAGILIDVLCYLSKNQMIPQSLTRNVLSNFSLINIFQVICLLIICLSIFCQIFVEIYLGIRESFFSNNQVANQLQTQNSRPISMLLRRILPQNRKFIPNDKDKIEGSIDASQRDFSKKKIQSKMIEIIDYPKNFEKELMAYKPSMKKVRSFNKLKSTVHSKVQFRKNNNLPSQELALDSSIRGQFTRKAKTIVGYANLNQNKTEYKEPKATMRDLKPTSGKKVEFNSGESKKFSKIIQNAKVKEEQAQEIKNQKRENRHFGIRYKTIRQKKVNNLTFKNSSIMIQDINNGKKRQILSQNIVHL